MLPLIEAYKAGLFTIPNLKKNIIAGFIVGIVALPLAMGFAIASGVQPEQGIYTAIIAGLIVGIFGGTRVQISGPTGAFVVILAAITSKYGVAGLQIATVMAGIVLILMGIFKLGTVVRFVPYPVIVGFTSGVGLLIFVSQLKDFFGLNLHLSLDAPFYEKLFTIFGHIKDANPTTSVMSIICILIVIYSHRFIKSLPSPLLAMLFATLVQYFFSYEDLTTLGDAFGPLNQSLPSFSIPDFTGISWINLIGPALTIAFLGAVESLLSAAAADSMMGTKHYSNQELIGQGLANIAAPFWGGFASTGAIARTVTNIRHGGNSPIAAIVHSVVLILTILTLAPYAAHIPLCALSAILVIVAYNMSDIPEFVHIIKRAPWYDVYTLLVTFFLTVFTDLVIAVFVGVILAIFLFIFRFHQEGRLGKFPSDETRYQRVNGLWLKMKEIQKQTVTRFASEEGVFYTIDGPFFFGVAEKIETSLSFTHTDSKFIVFCLNQVPFMDMTGLQTFLKVIGQYKKRGLKIYLWGANSRVSEKISRANILVHVEFNKIFHTLEEIEEITKEGAI